MSQASVFCLVALATLFAVPAAAQQPPPALSDGTIEIVVWSPETPSYKFRQVCVIRGASVTCEESNQIGPIAVTGHFTGTVRGSTFTGNALYTGSDPRPECSYRYEHRAVATIDLAPDGTLVIHATGGVTNYLSVAGRCAPYMPKTVAAADATSVGTWRVVSAEVPAVTVLPTETTLVTRDGRRITVNLDDLKAGKPSVELMEAKNQLTFDSSTGSAVTIPLYAYPRTGTADPPVYAGMKNYDDLALEGALATAAWAKANPDKAALAVLGLAINIAMPYTTAFQAAAGGMTFAEGAGIGFMTAFAPSAVSTLVSSAAKGEGAWKATGKAVVKGAFSGVESLPSTATGSAVTAVGQALAGESLKTTVNVLSGVASSASDQMVSDWHDKAAASFAKSTPPIPDLAKPAPPPSTGGIELTFDR